jgi:DNA-binding transcriptional MocR family regulator
MKRSQRKKQATGLPGLPLDSEITSMAQQIGLSMPERFLIFRLRSSMNAKNLVCWKSEQTLAEEMGCSRKTVVRAVEKLNQRGLITVAKRKTQSGEVNEYRLNFPWKCSSKKGEVRDTESHRSGEGLGTFCPRLETQSPKGYGTQSPINKQLNKKQVSYLKNKQENHHPANAGDDDFFLRKTEKRKQAKPNSKKQKTGLPKRKV